VLVAVALAVLVIVYGASPPIRNSMLDWWVSPHVSPLSALAVPANDKAKVFAGTILYAEDGGKFRFTSDLHQVERILYNSTHTVTLNRTSIHFIIHSRDVHVSDYVGQYFDATDFTELAVFSPKFQQETRTSGILSTALDVTRYSTLDDIQSMGNRTVSKQSEKLPLGKYLVTLLVTYTPPDSADEVIVAYKTWALSIVSNVDNYVQTPRGVVDYTIPLLLTIIPLALLVAGIIVLALYWKE
jgi:hypothetical protein